MLNVICRSTGKYSGRRPSPRRDPAVSAAAAPLSSPSSVINSANANNVVVMDESIDSIMGPQYNNVEAAASPTTRNGVRWEAKLSYIFFSILHISSFAFRHDASKSFDGGKAYMEVWRV